uniref:transposase n=1 Tax=Ligilactobacillus ruminis TaxID=1623 RepID=UPI0022E48442
QAESTSLQRVNRDLDDAFQRFFNPDLQNGFPRLKSKKNTNQSYTSKFVNNNIRIVDEHHIKLPKLGLVYFKAGRILNGKIRAVTVRVNSRKQYQASILVESENQTFKKTKKSVGIDLGLKSLTITSDGQKEDILKVDDGLNKQLRIWERKKSRRYENAKKVRTVAKLKRHIAERRRDNLHKLTTRLVKDYDTIVVENLSVKNMMKNHHLSAAIANASWGTLISQ